VRHNTREKVQHIKRKFHLIVKRSLSHFHSDVAPPTIAALAALSVVSQAQNQTTTPIQHVLA
jgi:hypothetical protein